MPKYHFQCKDCTRTWWEWMPISKCDHETCPHCGKGPPQKIPSNFSSTRTANKSKSNTGDIVEQAIIDSKQEHKKEIEKMRNKTYDNT